MIGDARFRMPSIEGVMIDQQLKEYFGSVGNAISKAVEDLASKINDASRIMVPTGSGMRPLSDVMSEDRAQPGDLILTTASRAVALRRVGWVICDGKNGTPDTFGAVPVGAADSTNPGIEIVGANPITSGGPIDGAGAEMLDTLVEDDDPVYSLEGEPPDGCEPEGTPVAPSKHHHEHNHFHGVDILTYMKTFSVIVMMKL